MQDLNVHKHAFQPKDHAEAHTVSLNNDTASGYDLVLFIDRKDTATADSGFMLELGINADGSIGGQVTAHPGFDPLAVFECTQDTLTISDASSGVAHVITDREPSAVPAPPQAVPAIDAAELMRRIRNVVAGARAIDDRLDDRDNDGRNAQAPDGDNYNELWGELAPLFDLVPRPQSSVGEV